MFTFDMAILVVWAFAQPLSADFGDAVFAISRLRFDGVKVFVCSLDLVGEFCDCFTAFFSCCCYGCHVTTPLLCSICNHYYKMLATNIINTTTPY